jgi:hypothetical protein
LSIHRAIMNPVRGQLVDHKNNIIPTALNKFAFDIFCSANRFDFFGV